MNRQVLSIEQMQHLKELGLDISKSNFYWHRTMSLNNYTEWDDWELHYGVLKLARGFRVTNCEYVNTFTLQDILELLPYKILIDFFLTIIKDKRISSGESLYHISYSNTFGVYKTDKVEFISANLIDAAYEMLCWCIENGYIKTKEL